MAADSDLALWRAQLAEEESDEEDFRAMAHPAARVPPPRRAAGPAAGFTSGGGAAPAGADQAVYLQHKMQVLQLQLEERDLELQEVRMHAANQRAAAERSSGNGASSKDSFATDAREAKLKELAGKSKQSTMALGREKALSSQQAAELATLRAQLKEKEQQSSGSGESSPARELRELQQRLADATKRLSEQQLHTEAGRAEVRKSERPPSKDQKEAPFVKAKTRPFCQQRQPTCVKPQLDKYGLTPLEVDRRMP